MYVKCLFQTIRMSNSFILLLVLLLHPYDSIIHLFLVKKHVHRLTERKEREINYWAYGMNTTTNRKHKTSNKNEKN